MGLHDNIIEKYGKYRITSEEYVVNDNPEYMFTLTSTYQTLLKGKYTILGAYSPDKNIWIWGDRSHILDTTMVSNIREIRKHIISTNPDDLILGFAKEHYKVLPSNELDNIINRLEDITKKHILRNPSYGKIDFLSVDKITYNSLPK